MTPCAEMVRASDPDRFLTVMAAPEAVREGLFALYAFNLEVARVPWITSEEMIAEMRLQWWLDTIDEIYAGNVGPHEIAAPLAEVISKNNLPKQLFVSLIQARQFDIYREGHADRAAFDAYIAATSSGLIQLAAMSLGAKNEALPVIADFGYGVGVANLLRALPSLYRHGRNPVPVNCALDRNAVAEGIVPENLSMSLKKITTSTAERVRLARQNRSIVPKSALAAMLVGWQVDVPLALVNKQPLTVLRRPLETSEFRKKAELLWRSSTGRW